MFAGKGKGKSKDKGCPADHGHSRVASEWSVGHGSKAKAKIIPLGRLCSLLVVLSIVKHMAYGNQVHLFLGGMNRLFLVFWGSWGAKWTEARSRGKRIPSRSLSHTSADLRWEICYKVFSVIIAE